MPEPSPILPPDALARPPVARPWPAWVGALALLLALPWLNPFSPGPSPAALPLLFAWTCAGCAGLFLALRRQPPDGADLLRALALAWSAAALLSALIGLLQYLGATAPLGVWVNHTGPGEAFGNLRQRNQFSTLMAIGLASLLWWAAQAPGRAGLIALAGLAALLGAGNAASSSRTGLVQWAALTLLALWWLRGAERGRARRVRWVLLAAGLAYVLAMLLLPELIGRDPASHNAWARLRAGDEVCAGRLTVWRNVLHLISLRPWAGWGWGELDYAHFITLYAGPRFCDILDNAHNLPLHLAVELGVPVALLVCALALWLIWRGRPWRESDPQRQLAWAVLLVIGLHSLLEYPLWYGPFQLAALASAALLLQPALAAALTPPARSRLRRSAALLAAAVLLLCAFAAWNYHVASQIYLPPAQRDAAYRDDTLARSQGLWLYADQVRFAELSITEPTPDNAAQVRALALALLHFSPEARVVRALLEADRLLGRQDELAFYAARFKAAFPADHARWLASQP